MNTGATSAVYMRSVARNSLSWVRLRADVWLWRAGWGPMVVAALGLVTVVAWLAVLGPMEARQRVLSQELARLDALKKQRVANRASDALVMQPIAQDPRNGLDVVLSPRADTAPQIRKIYQIAQKEQLALSQATFDQSDAVGDQAGRVRMNMPVTGSYPRLRRFLEETLREMPNVSIDQLTFKRSQVGQPEVETRVHLSLWTKPEGAASRLARPSRSGGGS